MKLIKRREGMDLGGMACLVEDLKALFKKPQVLLLEGEVGVGKTTFTGLLLKDLHREHSVPPNVFCQPGGDTGGGSPAFSIQHTYYSYYGDIHHVDLYRLRSSEDLESTGFWDIFAGGGQTYLVIVEWADRLNPQCWPIGWNYIRLRFLFGKTDNVRNIEIFI